MEEKRSKNFDDYDENTFFLIIVISIVLIILFLVYLSFIITYIIKNYHTKQLCVFWFDYCLLIFTGIIFIIIYAINLIYNRKRINNPIDLSNNFFSISIILSLTTMCVTIIGSLFFDSIVAIKLSKKMNDLKKITETEFYEVPQKFKDIKIINILKMKNNFIYYTIFTIINIIYIVLCYLAYRDTNIDRFNGYLNLYSYFTYLLRFYHLIILILLIISIILMNNSKNSLLKKYYYNPNRIAQKIYDIHFGQIVYFTDVLSVKLVSNLIMSIPSLFFLSLERFNTFSLIFSEIAIFIFIFIGGSENLILDKDIVSLKLNEKIKFLFCLRKLDFHFGEKDHRANFDDLMRNYSEDDLNILNDLSLNGLNDLESIFINFNDVGTESSILGLNKTNTVNTALSMSTFHEPEKRIIDFKTISEFYLVQKLMMIYFDTNKKVYESAIDSLDENFTEFKKYGNERKSKRKTLNATRDSLILNIDKISRLSIKDIEKIKPSIKISQSEVFTSIEEKELFEKLKNKLNIKNEKYMYKIESICSSELFELFPFFQMKISNISKSLNPARNIKIFNKFINRNNIQNRLQIVNKDNRLSVTSYKGLIDSSDNSSINENKKELDKNLYYTHDLYLMYEIYDKSDFINLNELEGLIHEYNTYLLSVVKNMNYSFLPIILGIFSLEIYDSHKIIILYRNPLFFTNFYKFNHWINFYITEEPEKIKVSSLFNDVIDVNEIEIKNILELNEDDYEEVKNNLKNDYSFLKKINNIYPIIHLFIGDENNNGIDINMIVKRNKNLFFEKSILGELSTSNEYGFYDALENNFSMLNNNIDDNNEVNENSLFDKEYFCIDDNSIRTIKIYFTNLFRRNCELNAIQGNKVNSELYCQYLQDQLMNYLIKNTLFNDEEDDKNTEENKENNESENM